MHHNHTAPMLENTVSWSNQESTRIHFLCLARAAGRPQTAEIRQSGWRVFLFHRRHGAFSALFILSPNTLLLYTVHSIVKKTLITFIFVHAHNRQGQLFIYGYFNTHQQLLYFQFAVLVDIFRQSDYKQSHSSYESVNIEITILKRTQFTTIQGRNTEYLLNLKGSKKLKSKWSIFS
jgi:hypothetical protein